MKILITGGTGFVGRNLAEGLRDKYSVFTPTHEELDVENFSYVEKYITAHKIDIIIHAALQGGDTVLETMLIMFASILRNAGKVDKIIYFGSGAEYAKIRDLKKVKEEEIGKYIPKDNYGLGKYICNQLASNEKKIINLRLFGIYGKYENYLFKFISNSIAKNLLGLPIQIKQDVLFDYLYIDDLIPVVEYFLNHQSPYRDYNITPNKSITLKEICEIINEITKIPSKISIGNKKQNFIYTGDDARILKTIPNLHFTSYEDGIGKLFSYHKDNIKKLDRNALIKDDYLARVSSGLLLKSTS